MAEKKQAQSQIHTLKRKYPIYEELSEAYDYYNKELFAGLLPECIIILSKKVSNFGHFNPNNFTASDGSGILKHEIGLNVQMFAVRSLELTLATLVHEMCHLKTYEDGNFGRYGYHPKPWASLMKKVGLIPSTTGEPGGAEIGQSVSHYVEAGGLFEEKTKQLLAKGFLISFVEKFRQEVKTFPEEEMYKRAVQGKPGYYMDDEGNEVKGKTVRCGKDEKGKDIVKILIKDERSKRLYVCKCNNKVWGKPDLSIKCNKCNSNFRETGKQDD